MDLVLNKLQSLICHKPKQTNKWYQLSYKNMYGGTKVQITLYTYMIYIYDLYIYNIYMIYAYMLYKYIIYIWYIHIWSIHIW